MYTFIALQYSQSNLYLAEIFFHYFFFIILRSYGLPNSPSPPPTQNRTLFYYFLMALFHMQGEGNFCLNSNNTLLPKCRPNPHFLHNHINLLLFLPSQSRRAETGCTNPILFFPATRPVSIHPFHSPTPVCDDVRCSGAERCVTKA